MNTMRIPLKTAVSFFRFVAFTIHIFLALCKIKTLILGLSSQNNNMYMLILHLLLKKRKTL